MWDRLVYLDTTMLVPQSPTGSARPTRRVAVCRTLRVWAWVALSVFFGSFLARAQATSPPPRLIELTLDGDRVSAPGLVRTGSAAPTLRLAQGESVVLRWSAARPTVLHLHGYRLAAEAGPGKVAELAFTARAAGRFAVETHRADGRHAALLYLEVLPR